MVYRRSSYVCLKSVVPPVQLFLPVSLRRIPFIGVIINIGDPSEVDIINRSIVIFSKKSVSDKMTQIMEDFRKITLNNQLQSTERMQYYLNQEYFNLLFIEFDITSLV